MSNTHVVRACFDAYLAQDQDTAAALLADDYVFTSPQDDHIDKDAFLQRCFPTTARLNWQRLLSIADIAPHNVFILYEYELTTGEATPQHRGQHRPRRPTHGDPGLLRRCGRRMRNGHRHKITGCPAREQEQEHLSQ